jgi:hypothetical protein
VVKAVIVCDRQYWIRVEIERTRQELGDTVEAVAAKADVKAQAKDRVGSIKDAAEHEKDEVVSRRAPFVVVLRPRFLVDMLPRPPRTARHGRRRLRRSAPASRSCQ